MTSENMTFLGSGIVNPATDAAGAVLAPLAGFFLYGKNLVGLAAGGAISTRAFLRHNLSPFLK
ncbi:MAG: hypothetical protein AAB928_00400 [Patescibacteria group bacterium]